jgi:DNA-binding MarR family transcriptional regulator
MDTSTLRGFRKNIRHLEQELNMHNCSNCCHGVTLAQCHALLELDSHKSLTLNELSERLYLDKSTVSRTIESLVNMGIVTREIPRENRRTVSISLTGQGKDICNQIHKESDAYFEAVLDSIPEQDLPAFMRSIEAVAQKMIQLNR